MAGKTTELRFPAAGVGRGLPYADSGSKQDAYAAPWACNVWPIDPFERRLRGGSRPGLTSFAGSSVGGGTGGMASVQVSTISTTTEKLVRVSAAGAVVFAGQQCAYSISGGAVTKVEGSTGSGALLAATSGEVPTLVQTGTVYRNRLFLGGLNNAIYASAIGDHTNWDSTVDPSRSTRALAPFQLGGAAEVGDVPTAMVPFRDASLLLATANSLWALRGDPGAAGGLTEVSRKTGILSARGWCRVDDMIVFLASDGLWACGPDGGNLANLSAGRLPDDLFGVNPSTTTILLGYERDSAGIHIYLGSGAQWFFHLPTKTFWPIELSSGHTPNSLCVHDGQLVLGCNDGTARTVGGTTDGGVAIESHLLVGPVQVGGEPRFGMLQSLHGVMADGSGTVNWRVVLGDTAEDAAANGKAAILAFQAGTSYAAYVASSGSWSEGRSHIAYPKVRGVWACIWLQSTARWGFERVITTTAPAARWR